MSWSDGQPTRRSFLAGAAALGTATAAGLAGAPAFIPRRAAAADQIRIGVTEPITGVYAELARSELRGMRLAVERQNRLGGVLSRQVELVVEDNTNNPGVAVQKARKLFQVDRVDALIGTVNSAISVATSNVAFEFKKPFIVSGGHTDIVNGPDCHWTTFRVCKSTWMQTQATGFSIAGKLGKKWFMINPDYAYGHSIADGYLAVAKKADVRIIGNDFAPLGTADFSSYIAKIMSAAPDVLIVGQGGEDFTNLMKQAASQGLLARIQVAGPLAELENFWPLPKEARVGSWGVEWYYDSPLVFGPDNAEAADFVKTYSALHQQPPTARSAFGYIAARRIMDGIAQAKSTDAVAICKAIPGQQFDALCTGQSYFAAVDHQLIWPMWFGKIRPNGTASAPLDIFDIVDAQPGDKIAKPASEQAKVCKLGYPAA